MTILSPLPVDPHNPASILPDLEAAIAGQAWITGLYQMGLDPTDPYPNGFTLADTWMNTI